METTFDYLRAQGSALGNRILETYLPLQSKKDPVAPRIATLPRKELPAQALAITGTAKYLRKAKAARIGAKRWDELLQNSLAGAQCLIRHAALRKHPVGKIRLNGRSVVYCGLLSEDISLAQEADVIPGGSALHH